MAELFLCETHADDFEEYYTIRCSPADIYWNGYTCKPNKEEFKKLYLNRITSVPFEKPEDRHLYLMRLKHPNEDDVNIGFVQLIKRDDGVEIGYSVTEDFQGKGYATAAVKQAIMLAQKYSDSISIRIRDDNIASQRVGEKNGFIPTEEYELNEYPKCGFVKLRKYHLTY